MSSENDDIYNSDEVISVINIPDNHMIPNDIANHLLLHSSNNGSHNVKDNVLDEIVNEELTNEVGVVVVDNTIIKQQMREHSLWLQTKSEDEFMRHYKKGHNIFLNSAQYISQDLMMGCAECKTCGMSWNTYSLDNSLSKVRLPHNEPGFFCKLHGASMFDSLTHQTTSLDIVDFSKKANTKMNESKNYNHTNESTTERVKIKII